MAYNVRITANGLTQVIDHLGRIRINVPNGCEDMAKDIARRYSENLAKAYKMLAITRNTGILWASIHRVYKAKTGKDNVLYRVGMPGYGPLLSYMKPHQVGVYGEGKNNLMLWAAKRGIPSNVITVRPRNFIDPAGMWTRQQLPGILDRYVKQMVR